MTVAILSSAFYIPIYGQSQSIITIETTKASYKEGDIIPVSGKVSPVIGQTPLIIQVFHQGNNTENLVEVRQISVAKDGTFSESILAEKPQWRTDGEYIIRASYGPNAIAEASIMFSTQKEDLTVEDLFEVDAGQSGTFDVQYAIGGGKVSDMFVEPEALSLVVELDSTDDGSITLSLPREFIDAKKQNSKDERFIVLLDNNEIPYDEVKTTKESRTIRVAFEEDTSQIRIIGTYAIPEFGLMAILVLPVSITVAIITLKTRRIVKPAIL